MTQRSSSLKVEFVDNASSQYDDSAARIKFADYKSGGKLFVGDNSAASYVQLKHRKCKVVVCCSRDLHGFCKEPDVTYLKIDPDDDADSADSIRGSSSSKKSKSADECRNLQRAFDFIRENLAEKKNVLVSCENGLNRSAAVVAYFLMMRDGVSLAEAYTVLRHARGELNIRPAVIQLLMRVEVRLRGLNTVRLDGRRVIVESVKKLTSPTTQRVDRSSSTALLAIAAVVVFFAAVFGAIYLATGKL